LKIINNCEVKHLFKKLKFKHPELFARMELWATTYGLDYRFSEKLYMYAHDLKVRPNCTRCGSVVKTFYGFNNGYAIYCGTGCVARDPLTKSRRKATLQRKHGVDSPVKLRWKK